MTADLARSIAPTIMAVGEAVLVLGLIARWWDPGHGEARGPALVMDCYLLLLGLGAVLGGLGLLALR